MIKVLPVPKVDPVFPDVKTNMKMREKKELDLTKGLPKAKKSKIKFVPVDLKSRKRRKKRLEDVTKGKPTLLPSKIPQEEPKVLKKDKFTDISKIILGNLENALEKAKRKKKKAVESVVEKKNPPPLKKLLLGKTEDEKNMISKKIKNILKAPHDIKFVDEDAKKVSKKKIKKSLSAKKILKEEEMKVKRALSEEKLLKRFVKNGMTLPTDKVERKKIIDRLWQTKRSLWKKRAQIMKQLEETSRAELREVNEQGDQVKTYVVPETVKAKGKNNFESVVYFDAKEKTIRPPSQDDFSKLAKPKIKNEKKSKLNNLKANKEILMKELKADKEIFKEKREKKKKTKTKVKVQNVEIKEEVKKEMEKPHLPERTYKKMVKDVANFIKKEEKKIIHDLHEKIKSDNLDEDKHEMSENVQNFVSQTEKPILKSNVKPNLKAKEVKRPRKILSRAASRSRNISKTKLKPQPLKKAEVKVKEKILKVREEPEKVEVVEKSVETVREPPKIIKKQNAQSQVEMEKMLQRKAAFAQRLRVQMEQNKRVFVEMTKKKDPSKLRVVSRNDDTDISLSAPLSFG